MPMLVLDTLAEKLTTAKLEGHLKSTRWDSLKDANSGGSRYSAERFSLISVGPVYVGPFRYQFSL